MIRALFDPIFSGSKRFMKVFSCLVYSCTIAGNAKHYSRGIYYLRILRRS